MKKKIQKHNYKPKSHKVLISNNKLTNNKLKLLNKLDVVKNKPPLKMISLPKSALLLLTLPKKLISFQPLKLKSKAKLL